MKSILAHFSIHDPVMHQALVAGNITELEPAAASSEYFQRLCRSIVGQQLSTKVAEVIYGRFLRLFDSENPTPEAVLAVPDESLRAVGLSWSKVTYLKDLATRAATYAIPFERLGEMSEEEVIGELTQIKGVGQWTAEMFLMFTLRRPDIFSKGDLGLRRGMQKLYGLEEAEWFARVDEITELWRPYRTYASMAVWHSLDNAP